MTTLLEPEDLPVDEALRQKHAPYFVAPERAGGFHNPWGHAPLPGFKSVLKWKLEGNRLRPPEYQHPPLSPVEHALAELEALQGDSRVFWIGHASFLFDMSGVRFVIDPVFGRAGGVVKRLSPPAARAEELGEVSAVLVTHGHHDHLDPKSLKELALQNRDRVVFVVPRGLGKALPKVCRPVVELSWWQSVLISSVRVTLVPAQHWHQRGLLDKNESLWGGFVVEGRHRVYHSGDTGFFGGFQAIGDVFGEIDAACLPLGAYEPVWMMSTQHMGPAESLAAFADLRAKHFVGMHWGTFDLSNEPVDAGARYVGQVVRERGLPEDRFHVLRTGGSLSLSDAQVRRAGVFSS